ncbi:MAG: hypothetical protein LBU28_10550 [Spirochaetaceae bacterium]|jgi:hypothetical protein|nr:hypothetical protein [Spirochaetaceae bacterium]
MLSREDFIFTIGYDGPNAVVDSQAKKRYGGLSTRELAAKGLFRAAYASAIYARASQKPEGGQAGQSGDISALVEAYNQVSGAGLTVDSALDRLFGVFPVEVKRAIVL